MLGIKNHRTNLDPGEGDSGEARERRGQNREENKKATSDSTVDPPLIQTHTHIPLRHVFETSS